MSQADDIRSFEDYDGLIYWYKNNELFKVVYANGIEWYQNGLLHRVDGPAIVEANGARRWYQNGKVHRVDGPAVVYPTGEQRWYQNGNLHRVDGPAIVEPDGRLYWYQNNACIDDYYPNFGCGRRDIHNRREAIERLNSRPRPYSYDLYMADIDRLFPEEN